MKAPKKITFEGFYGFKNSGDDAFIEVASWGARKYWKCKNNVFLGEELPEVKYPINRNQYLSKIKGFDRFNLIRHLSNSDYLISAGGSTFSELPFHSNKVISKSFKKIKSGLQLGGIGVSVGPFKTVSSEKKIAEYLKSLDFLSVRDFRSFQYVNSLDLPYQPIHAFDLAAMLPSVYQNHITERKINQTKTIGISICNYERYTGGPIEKEKKRNSYFKELVHLIAKTTNVKFKVFIFNGNSKTGDWAVTQELMSHIDKNRIEIIPYLGNVEKTWIEVSGCDLMISTRLHASIFACYAEVPFMLLEYHEKCNDFLNDVGHHETYRLFDAETPLEKVVPVIKEILAGNYKPPSNIAETIALSEKNFTKTLVIT